MQIKILIKLEGNSLERYECKINHQTIKHRKTLEKFIVDSRHNQPYEEKKRIIDSCGKNILKCKKKIKKSK